MLENAGHSLGLSLEADELDLSFDLAAERLQMVAKAAAPWCSGGCQARRDNGSRPDRANLRAAAATLDEGHPVYRGPSIDELLLERELIEMLDRASASSGGS